MSRTTSSTSTSGKMSICNTRASVMRAVILRALPNLDRPIVYLGLYN